MSEGSPGNAWAVFEDKALGYGFTQIPNFVTRNPNLSMQAKYIYGLLLSYAWQDAECFPGLSKLRHDTGAKVDTLRKYIRELEDFGLLEVKGRRGYQKTNLYIFKALTVTTDNPQRGVSSDPPTGGTTNTHYKDSVSSFSYEKGSAPPEPRNKGSKDVAKKKPWMATYIDLAERSGVVVSREDRKRFPGNFVSAQAKDGATDEEMYRVIMRMVLRGGQGAVLSPQEALKDIRGETTYRGNGYKKSPEPEMPYSPVI